MEAQRRREADPNYWRRLYEGLLEDEKEKKGQRNMWLGALVVLGVPAVIVMILSALGHYDIASCVEQLPKIWL